MKKRPQSHTLIIAEDIRAELNGKMSIMGITQAPIQLKLDDEKDYASHTIAAYGSFENFQDAKNVSIQISDADDEIISSGDVPVPKGQPDALVIAGKFENVRFKKSGKCTLTMTIDENNFKKEFFVIVS